MFFFFVTYEHVLNFCNGQTSSACKKNFWRKIDCRLSYLSLAYNLSNPLPWEAIGLCIRWTKKKESDFCGTKLKLYRNISWFVHKYKCQSIQEPGFNKITDSSLGSYCLKIAVHFMNCRLFWCWAGTKWRLADINIININYHKKVWNWYGQCAILSNTQNNITSYKSQYKGNWWIANICINFLFC